MIRASPRRLLNPLLDWLSPPRCAACGAALPSRNAVFCPDCEVSLIALQGPSWTSWQGVARGPSAARPRGEPVRAGYAYGGQLASAIRRYKYGGRFELARPLGRLLVALIPRSDAVVVTVPPSTSALRLRGFDHVRELVTAGGNAQLRGRLALPGTVVRVGLRPPQASLTLSQRRSLPARVFQVPRPQRVSERGVVLVDDVMTTGATMGALAEALRRVGAEVVERVTLARVV